MQSQLHPARMKALRGSGGRGRTRQLHPARMKGDSGDFGNRVGLRIDGAVDRRAVDDQSEDETAATVRSLEPARARSLRLIKGRDLPSGWFGKPWACHQGFQKAKGQLLLFTDADTWHAPDLLAQAVAGMDEDEADLLSLVGRQEMGSFWERTVQPHIFLVLAQLMPDLSKPFLQHRWRRAVANGQYILMRREAYEAIGGHGAVRRVVGEDVRLAQTMVRAGRSVVCRASENGFATRMYRSLGEIVAGWSKGAGGGLRQVAGPWASGLLLATGIIVHPLLWILPTVVLLAAPLTRVGMPLVVWAATVYLASAVFWGLVSRRAQASPFWGLLHPLAASVLWYIFVISALRGPKVRWKRREYHVGATS